MTHIQGVVTHVTNRLVSYHHFFHQPPVSATPVAFVSRPLEILCMITDFTTQFFYFPPLKCDTVLSCRCTLTFRSYIIPQHYNRMWIEWTLRVAASGPFNTVVSVNRTPPWKHQNSYVQHVSLSRKRLLSPIKLSIRLLRQYVSITFCRRHLDSGNGNSLRAGSTEGGTTFTSNFMQIVPAFELVWKGHRSGTHRGFQNACPKFFPHL